MIEKVSGVQATLVVSPDPPTPGRVHGVVTLQGSPTAAAHTDVRFSSSMPTMSMAGPSGAALRTGPDRWEFDAPLGMATTWNLSVHFSGGINGTAVYLFAVSGQQGGGSGMPGMSSTSGNVDAWRYAALALAVILIVAVLVVVVRRDRRPLTLGLILAAALVVVVLAVIQARYAAPAMDMVAMSNVRGSAATPVTLARIQLTERSREIHAPGTIAPFLTQDIITRAAGILTNFSVYSGDHVAAGQVIASLDSPDLQSRAAAASADAAGQAATARAADIEAQHHAPNAVVIAHADTAALQREVMAAQADRAAKAEQVRYWSNELRREKTLLDQGAVSVQEYQDETAQSAAAQAAYSAATNKVGSLSQQTIASQTKAMDAVASVSQMQAQAAAAQAQARRASAQAITDATLAGYATVTSPNDAIVVKRLIDPGVYVAAGTPIARIAVIRQLRVQANVAQQDLSAISIGTPVEARLQNGAVVRGGVTSLSPIADPTTHTALVEAIVNNTRSDLVPGGFAQVTIHARAAHKGTGIQVPSVAIVGSGADAAVWTDVNGTAHRVSVRIVSDDGTTATVTGDLARRARIVVDGAATLVEGQAIIERRS